MVLCPAFNGRKGHVQKFLSEGRKVKESSLRLVNGSSDRNKHWG
jgi:hypothetical protein